MFVPTETDMKYQPGPTWIPTGTDMEKFLKTIYSDRGQLAEHEYTIF
jgi:hypothetical protein